MYAFVNLRKNLHLYKLSLLEQLHSLNKHIYLLGDFNVNTLRTSTGLNSRANYERSYWKNE